MNLYLDGSTKMYNSKGVLGSLLVAIGAMLQAYAAVAQPATTPQLTVEKAETYTFQDPKSSATLRAVIVTVNCSSFPSMGDVMESVEFKIADDEGNVYGDNADTCGINNLPQPHHYKFWYFLEYKPIPKRAIGKVYFKTTSWSVAGTKFPKSLLLHHHP